MGIDSSLHLEKMEAGVLPIGSIRFPTLTYLRVIDQEGAKRSEGGKDCPFSVAGLLYRPSRPPRSVLALSARIAQKTRSALPTGSNRDAQMTALPSVFSLRAARIRGKCCLEWHDRCWHMGNRLSNVVRQLKDIVVEALTV